MSAIVKLYVSLCCVVVIVVHFVSVVDIVVNRSNGILHACDYTHSKDSNLNSAGDPQHYTT